MLAMSNKLCLVREVPLSLYGFVKIKGMHWLF